MERELLQHFLRSGPARKFDVSRVTREILRSKRHHDDLLFKSSYCNTTILFKCITFDDNRHNGDQKPIDMLVYIPYDYNNPEEGGESFLFTERTFWQYFTTKLRRQEVDLPALRADYDTLKVFDSVPTFTPFILELAFERANHRVPTRYLDLPPEMRTALRDQIKERIRPLTAAAFRANDVDAHQAQVVEGLTDKLFGLRNADEIKPLILALRIPEEEGVELLSAWIGITYFEYEYAKIQKDIRAFACWLNDFNMPRETLRDTDKKHIEQFLAKFRRKMRSEWGAMLGVLKKYIESYDNYVFLDKVDTFSAFLRECPEHYWRLADILGRFEQTMLTWQHFTRNYYNVPLPYFRLMELYDVLRRLHLSDERAQFLSSATFDDSLFKDRRTQA